ncbi:MAG TPA: type III pantothenate kinase [Usitatibacter sp.]|nr:type III pantothenate kinase [Usitatibacter sp.]
MSDSDEAILAIDSGNTRIKWAVHDGHAWSAAGAIATSDSATLYEAMLPAFPVDRAVASNVAGAEVAARIVDACRRARVELAIVVPQQAQLGVTNAYREPWQLGSDRWAALIAAHRGYKGHKLVVNVGTALTVDALTADGHFMGGLIVPGPALMRRSLDLGTAGLRLTEGAMREFPQGTADAITSGSIQASVGAITRLGLEMAARDCPVSRIILSGGAAGEIAAWLPYPAILQDNLVLDGLVAIARNA